MKKLEIFMLGLLLITASASYGQELIRKQDTNGKWGFVDEVGRVVIPYKYDDVREFSEGLAAVWLELWKTWVFIDKNDKVVIPFHFDVMDVNGFYEGLAAVQRSNTGKWGFVDMTGREIAPYKYDYVSNFSGGYATVNRRFGRDEQWGVINRIGEEVVPLVHFSRNRAETAAAIVRTESVAERTTSQATREREAAQARERALAQAAREREAAQAAPVPPPVPQSAATVISDVSVNIPTTNVRNANTFAVIIANENYRREARVEFAHNDGETFKKYCIQTLGLPASNVNFTADATLNDIRGEINWLSDVANAYAGEANIIFYYAGHGIPDETTRAAYLLPVDGWGSDVRTGYRLDELYQTLGRLPARSITIFLDACFSGAQRSGDMMASARGVAIRATPGAPVGNMVVFSASQGDETAFPYREQGHGMFTYFLLKKLQETRGNVTLGELGDYIVANVQRRSIVVNRRNQTPVVTPSAAVNNRWREMRLR